MELVKKVGNWLTKAMELREQMRKCFPSKPGNAVSFLHLNADRLMGLVSYFSRRLRKYEEEYYQLD